jgi:hypothetical protein
MENLKFLDCRPVSDVERLESRSSGDIALTSRAVMAARDRHLPEVVEVPI